MEATRGPVMVDIIEFQFTEEFTNYLNELFDAGITNIMFSTNDGYNTIYLFKTDKFSGKKGWYINCEMGGSTSLARFYSYDYEQEIMM